MRWFHLPAAVLAPVAALAASLDPNPPLVAVPRLAAAPSMKEDADLSTWQGALEITDFTMALPDDHGSNRWPTSARVAWGPDALYVAFRAVDPEPERVRASRHKRDDNTADMDHVAIDLDPSGKAQSVIRLRITPLGGQIDAIYTETAGEDTSYDLLWDSVGVRTPDGYVVKVRLPYSSLRRAPGEWRLRLARMVPRERFYGIVWPRVSRDVQCDICQEARITGAPVAEPSSPFTLVPFVAASSSHSADGGGDGTSRRLGLDLRYAGAAATLEGTYRPDFNNVDADVDPLQINSRFNVFYPEKRPFFLEGMELLGRQGTQRQFFSRSIAQPLYGIKASGNAALANWTVLGARDDGGGAMLAAASPGGGPAALAAQASQDTAAAVAFPLDERGSGISVVATDKTALGGPVHAGGYSGGLYLMQKLGSEFTFKASGIDAQAHLAGADGTSAASRGSATGLELDWDTRLWSAAASLQGTSPGLVLVSGFTDLRGYRRDQANLMVHQTWNEGPVSVAALNLRGRHLTWWNGTDIEQAIGLEGTLETAGRWTLSFSSDLAGRAWSNDGTRANAIRNLGASLRWGRHSWAQPYLQATSGRTMDLTTGDPATFKGVNAGASGSLGDLAYNAYVQQSQLQSEGGGVLLVRAREVVATCTWQFPEFIYLRAQSYLTRYDGERADSTDKFLKAFLGWQPNAFTGAYVGWSGQRRRDPMNGMGTEIMVQRGLFAKFAYAMQF